MTLQKIWVAMIFAYYLVYEIVFFFNYDFLGGRLTPFTNLWKLGFPVMLFVFVGLSSLKLLRRNHYLHFYSLVFALFLGWAFIPALLFDGLEGGILEWGKQLPRLAFFLGVVLFFHRQPETFSALKKLLICWAVLAVCQYVLLIVFRGYNHPVRFSGVEAEFAGPFGVFGNITSLMSIPGLPYPILRLCGFWNEPSNASASMFATFFLARGLCSTTKRHFWKLSSYACLFGGLACLSNAGYLALGCAFAFGEVFSSTRKASQMLHRTIVTGVGILFVAVALFGRAYVVENVPESEIARAITGVRQQVDNRDRFDVYGGRITIVEEVWESIKENPFGAGFFQTTAMIENGTLSGSAPILWLSLTGVLGLLLLLFREWFVWLAAIRNASRSADLMNVCQAWVVVLVQQTSYGSWMNPLYLILVAGVFATMTREVDALRVQQRKIAPSRITSALVQ